MVKQKAFKYFLVFMYVVGVYSLGAKLPIDLMALFGLGAGVVLGKFDVIKEKLKKEFEID